MLARAEPLRQFRSRTAILLVVVPDLLQYRGGCGRIAVLRHQPPLIKDHRLASSGNVAFPMAPIQVLHAFERIRRLSDEQPLPDNLEEIDKDAAPQHPIDLILTNTVFAHQPPESRHLVVVVVVNVEIRKLLPALIGPRDEAFQRLLLRLAVMRPPVTERQCATLTAAGAEQVFAAFIYERIALHVEVNVAV